MSTQEKKIKLFNVLAKQKKPSKRSTFCCFHRCCIIRNFSWWEIYDFIVLQCDLEGEQVVKFIDDALFFSSLSQVQLLWEKFNHIKYSYLNKFSYIMWKTILNSISTLCRESFFSYKNVINVHPLNLQKHKKKTSKTTIQSNFLSIWSNVKVWFFYENSHTYAALDFSDSSSIINTWKLLNLSGRNI